MKSLTENSGKLLIVFFLNNNFGSSFIIVGETLGLINSLGLLKKTTNFPLSVKDYGKTKGSGSEY